MMQKIIYIKQLPRYSVPLVLSTERFFMSETVDVPKSEAWKSFIRKHWKIVVIFLLAGLLIFAGAVYVFWWFVGDAQSTGLVPSLLHLWTMNNMLMFVLHLIFWELLLIGIPAIIVGVAGWQWWKRLPAEERNSYHFSGKHSKARDGGSGVSVLVMLAFALKVYIDGNWNVAVGSWTFDYVVNSLITILIWSVVIFGIPAVIIGALWIHRELNKKT